MLEHIPLSKEFSSLDEVEKWLYYWIFEKDLSDANSNTGRSDCQSQEQAQEIG